jgi:hypothetical protein
MITDIQLAIFSNVLGVSIFLLIILYHYISVNSSKNCKLKNHSILILFYFTCCFYFFSKEYENETKEA